MRGVRRSSTADRDARDVHQRAPGNLLAEPICAELPIAPDNEHAAKTRLTSARQLHDERLTAEVLRVRGSNHRVYGRRMIWAQFNPERIPTGRDRCGTA